MNLWCGRIFMFKKRGKRRWGMVEAVRKSSTPTSLGGKSRKLVEMGKAPPTTPASHALTSLACADLDLGHLVVTSNTERSRSPLDRAGLRRIQRPPWLLTPPTTNSVLPLPTRTIPVSLNKFSVQNSQTTINQNKLNHNEFVLDDVTFPFVYRRILKKNILFYKIFQSYNIHQTITYLKSALR